MPGIVRFKKQSLRVQYGDLKWLEGQTLMECLISAGLPVASSCGGDGVCTKCRLQVTVSDHGADPTHLYKTPLEQTLLRKIGAAPEERISCQVTLRSEPDQGRAQSHNPVLIEVDAPYW